MTQKYHAHSLGTAELLLAQKKQPLIARGMVMAVTVGEEFDGISEIYDSTRQAATEA